MNIILGNGVSSYVIAACLSYLNKEFVIYGNPNKTYFAPDILFLKVEKDEIDYYLSILGSKDKTNIKNIKVGYWYDNELHSTITNDAKKNYFAKQNRKECSTSMSDGKSEFLAIDLKSIVVDLIKRYKVNDINDYKYNSKDIIYDTINYYGITIDNPNSFEFISKNDYFDVKDYDYVYDCTNSLIKRYTKNYIEYLEAPQKEYKAITNYYISPKIYKHNNITLLGRNTTKTQMKQKDVIDYLIKNIGVVEYV